MKKTLIASAVAAATLSSTAFAMDPASDLAERLDSMPTFYGNIQLAWTGETEDDGTNESSTNEFGDNGSTLGIKHEHMISDGLTGFLKAEFHFDADETTDGANSGLGESLDEAYIGVKGDFGMVQAGTDDTVYEWVDVVDMYEATGLDGELAADKEGDNVQYVSPEMSGLTVGVTAPVDSDSVFGGALAAKYGMDDLGVVAAYSMGRDEGSNCGTNPCDSAGDTLGLAVTYGIDDLSFGIQYETRDDSSLAGDKSGQDYLALLAQYSMGANNFALGYEMSETNGTMEEIDAGGVNMGYVAATSPESTGIYFQALHNVSDQMYVYLEYTMKNTETSAVARDAADGGDIAATDVDTDILAIGATYAF